MRRPWSTAILLALATVVWAAEPPAIINYQGVLRNADGSPRDGAHQMAFWFYDQETGGFPLLGDIHTSTMSSPVVVSGGLFHVRLGGGVILPSPYESLADLFRHHGEVWMEIAVEGESLSPRVQVLAAAHALNADHLDGYDSSYFLDAMDPWQASGNPAAWSEFQHCVLSEFGPDCSQAGQFVVHVPPGSESTLQVGVIDQSVTLPMQFELTTHARPDPPTLPDSCHPGVEVTVRLGGTPPGSFCVSPSRPIHTTSWEGQVPTTVRLLPNFSVAIMLLGDGFDSPISQMQVSDGIIASVAVDHRPDGTARADVEVGNNGPYRTTYVVTIGDCTTSCTEPPPRASSITMDAIQFLLREVTFDLPECGGAVGTNQCTATLMALSGSIYDTYQFNF